MQVRSERTEALRAWLSGAKEVVFLDALYDPDGRERETIQPIFEVIRESFGGEIQIPENPVEQGSHPRWTQSYSALRPMPPQKVQLPAISGQSPDTPPVISASALENYSRCGFLALARTRWRLEDQQEPETDLWPQVKGILLHEAVRILVESRDAEGNFSKRVEDAVDDAWAANPPKGLLRGARIEGYVKRKLCILLRVFKDQERKYVERARTRVLALENLELSVDYPGFSVRGKPDRIDEHPDGLWVIDYKTSSSAPNGSVMLENGYRLQLPFYALAAQKKYSKPTLGLQFVQLDKKGTRTNGVYFKPHNGKEPGKLTDTTARSKSLLAVPREDAWSKFEEEIIQLGARYVSGSFEARPRISPRSKECDSCQVADFCGYRRILEESDGEEGGGE
jgi:RecB family exonuclease